MKTKQLRHSKRTTGHILLVSVMVTAVVAFLVVAYLKLVQSQSSFTARSQTWEGCVPIAEAGIEEAMAHMNTMTANNFAVNGWTLVNTTSSSGYLGTVLAGGTILEYFKERAVGDGFSEITIAVNSTNYSKVVITATAYLPAPVTVARGGSVFFANLNNSLKNPNTSYLTRTIRVIAQQQPLFAKGMVAKHDINLNGNNVFLDSFDSSDPNFSGPGGAYDPAKNKDNGGLATNSGLIDSLNTGNAEIMGKVSTGPGGSVTVGTSGSVGSEAWVTGGNQGIEPGYSSDDMNVGFMDVQKPFSGGLYPLLGAIYNLQIYDYHLGSGQYRMPTFSMGGKQKMIVTGHAELYVPGDFQMTGSSFIEIAPGASLKLYVGGTSASIGGNGIANKNATPDTFTYYGLPNNQYLSMAGNAQFVGGIYAPNAAFTLGGGGNNTTDFIGASVTKSVQMNGHFNFHYDEALGNFGPTSSYTITSWNEI